LWLAHDSIDAGSTSTPTTSHPSSANGKPERTIPATDVEYTWSSRELVGDQPSEDLQFLPTTGELRIIGSAPAQWRLLH
jgi:hypothetical protein